MLGGRQFVGSIVIAIVCVHCKSEPLIVISKKSVTFGDSVDPLDKLLGATSAPTDQDFDSGSDRILRKSSKLDRKPLIVKPAPLPMRKSDISERALNIPDKLLSQIPSRAPDAKTGREFLAYTETLNPNEREDAIYKEIRSGNIPSFLRLMRPLLVKHETPEGQKIHGITWVSPDYFAIGSDSDFIRIPMNFYTAAKLGRAFNLGLPTRKIVNAAYIQSDVKLSPRTMTPGANMRSNQYYFSHNQRIEDDLRAQLGAIERRQLVSGHKKDVVISNRMLRRRGGSLVIYGWHQLDGQPIQPLSDAHDFAYADYSHGIRFVYGSVLVNGKDVNYMDAICDEKIAPIFTYDSLAPEVRELLKREPNSTPSSALNVH